MKVEFKGAFNKDLDSLSNAKLGARVKQAILMLEAAPSLMGFPKLEKLQGYPDYYRVRIGDYRLGLRLIGDTVICVRFLHRREVYRYFP